MPLKLNIVVMTKDEPEAFRLLREIATQATSEDSVLVWDDCSGEQWLTDYGAEFLFELIRDPLNRNFADHRNRCRQHIPPNEWIIMLDADEFIMPGFIEAVRHQASRSGVDCLFFERYNSFYIGDVVGIPEVPNVNCPFRPDFQGRGFRNIPSIRYEGRVHEGIVGYDWPVYLTGIPFTILHHKQRGIPSRYEHLVAAH